MGNSELFETKEETKVREKKYGSKNYKIGILILGLGIVTGIFLIPMIVENNGIPVIKDLIWSGESNKNPTENPFWDKIQTKEQVYDQKPEDTEQVSYSQANDQVGLSISNLPIFEYEIITDGSWSGDFVDMRKVPIGIQSEGYKKFQFRCFIDEQINKATYFGTFKSLEGKSIQVKVYRAGELYDDKFGSEKNAVIIEGIC